MKISGVVCHVLLCVLWLVPIVNASSVPIPATANTADQEFVKTETSSEEAVAIGFEDYLTGELPTAKSWHSPFGCDAATFRIVETGNRYPGFGLKALAATYSPGCSLRFAPFEDVAVHAGLLTIQWDFAIEHETDSWLRVSLANLELAPIRPDRPGIKTGQTKSTPAIHHVLVQINTTGSPSRITRYVDGVLVDDYKSESLDIASIIKSFEVEVGGGKTTWILDNLQFSVVPVPNALLVSNVVSPDQMNGWAMATETPTGQITFVTGPATPPAGSGSAQFTVNATGGVILYTLAYGGRRLDEVRTLAYSTYRTGADVQAVSLQFDIDYDVTDNNFAWSGRLVYEPYLTETVTPGIWQTWDPRAGKWWATQAPGNATCPQNAPCTWPDLLNAYPNAGILAYGALYFKAGSGWPGGYQWNLDDFEIGFTTDANDAEWDFEPEIPCTATCYVDGVNGNDANGGASPSNAKKSIQAAIDQATAGGSVIILPATYHENLHVTKSLDIGGTDKDTVMIQPLISNPNPCSNSSLCGCPVTSSNVILIEASNVTVHDITVDGDNTLDNSGIDAGGANIDARNGIAENYCISSFTNTVVHDTIVRNVFLRGIQSSTNSTFSIHHNNVSNVQASASSIAIFSFQGSGSFFNNTVSEASDGIAANWSKGIQFLDNVVTSSGSGIHTDNSHGAGGGAADLISGNSVSAGTSGSYGIWSFVPYTDVTIRNNTVINVDVGLGSFASAGGETVLRENIVTGSGAAGSAGVYISTTTFFWGETDSSTSMTGNTISNYETGVYVESNAGYTASATATCNSISGNSSEGVLTVGAGSFALDFTRNWWGSPTGPLHTTNPAGLGDEIVGDVPFNPWSQDIFPACSLLAAIPSRLVFIVQPTDTAANASISPALQVQAQDSDGNLGINFTGPVTLNFVANPGGAALSGTTTRNATAGVAVFDDISLDEVANGYMLVATTPELTGGISTTFNIFAQSVLSLAQSSYNAGEADGNVSIVISRTGGSVGAVSVTLNTSDISATAGSDYTAQSNVIVSFADGDTADKTVLIPITQDAAVEPTETLAVAISTPTNGAALGTTTNATVSILDDDVAPACLFCDEFDDSAVSGDWAYVKPEAWSEDGNNLIGTSAKKASTIATPAFPGCSTCTTEATMQTEGGVSNKVSFLGWYQNSRNYVELLMKQETGRWILKQRVEGKVVAKNKGVTTINPNQPYIANIAFDGTTFTVSIDGTQLFTLTKAPSSSPQGSVGFRVKATTGTFGYVHVN